MKIAVGLSGGVDSSVAAALLKEQGHELHGIFMQNWTQQGEKCSIEADWEDAQSVARILSIPIQKVDFSQIYWDRVFEHFLHELEQGRTPSPDILCNQHVKFGAFLNWALAEGFDAIATGHYASLSKKHELQKACDSHKDQTYFLWSVAPTQWKYVLFPLGDLKKPDVRLLAHKLHLPTATKKDSTGVCFIGPKNFKQFLKRYLCFQPGPIMSDHGQCLGQHEGLFGVTLGQRSGLNIGGIKNALEAPWYVIKKDLSTHTVTVSQNADHPLLLRKTLEAHNCVWQRDQPPFSEETVFARIRHGQTLEPCILKAANNIHNISVTFTNEQRAITPGQAIVFYNHTHCLGGGWID